MPLLLKLPAAWPYREVGVKVRGPGLAPVRFGTTQSRPRSGRAARLAPRLQRVFDGIGGVRQIFPRPCNRVAAHQGQQAAHQQRNSD